VNHFASPQFWERYDRLPIAIRQLAAKSRLSMMQDPQHPSISLKKVGQYYAARVGLHYRALVVETPDGLIWFWIGSHAESERIIG
jgi:hypothetical protein